MSKLRHIAVIVEDPEVSAKFFEEAFDMKRAGTARRGIYMSDGIFNVALLKKEGDERLGGGARRDPRDVQVAVVLAAHHGGGVQRPQAVDQAGLRHPPRVRPLPGRRLGEHAGEHLQHVVLHDVADRTGAVVEAAPVMPWAIRPNSGGGTSR